MSDLNKLKEVDYSDIPMGYQVIIIGLIERTEAAERERDELRAEQAEHDEQIARMESKFSLAKRALDSKTARCEKAEAELRRRDAAAGEPVGEIRLGDYGSDGTRPAVVLCLHDQADWENFPDGTKLYTRAEHALSRGHFEEAISLISRGCADISHHAVDSKRYADDQTQVFWENYLHSKEAIKCQK
jgi:hypothetical protein